MVVRSRGGREGELSRASGQPVRLFPVDPEGSAQRRWWSGGLRDLEPCAGHHSRASLCSARPALEAVPPLDQDLLSLKDFAPLPTEALPGD